MLPVELVSETSRRVTTSAAAGDWDGVRPLLHPYLRLTLADGTVVRGRNQVMAVLAGLAPPVRLAVVELRDDQAYRCRLESTDSSPEE